MVNVKQKARKNHLNLIIVVVYLPNMF